MENLKNYWKKVHKWRNPLLYEMEKSLDILIRLDLSAWSLAIICTIAEII